MVVSSSNLCQRWQEEVHFLSFLRWPDANCHSLCLFTPQRKHTTSFFINITLIKKNMSPLPTKGIKSWYFEVPSVTGVLFFHRLLSTPVGELLRLQPVQLQQAAALQEIQCAVNSSSDTQIPVVDSNGVQAKLFLYSMLLLKIVQSLALQWML